MYIYDLGYVFPWRYELPVNKLKIVVNYIIILFLYTAIFLVISFFCKFYMMYLWLTTYHLFISVTDQLGERRHWQLQTLPYDCKKNILWFSRFIWLFNIKSSKKLLPCSTRLNIFRLFEIHPLWKILDFPVFSLFRIFIVHRVCYYITRKEPTLFNFQCLNTRSFSFQTRSNLLKHLILYYENLTIYI